MKKILYILAISLLFSCSNQVVKVGYNPDFKMHEEDVAILIKSERKYF